MLVDYQKTLRKRIVKGRVYKDLPIKKVDGIQVQDNSIAASFYRENDKIVSIRNFGDLKVKKYDSAQESMASVRRRTESAFRYSPEAKKLLKKANTLNGLSRIVFGVSLN